MKRRLSKLIKKFLKGSKDVETTGRPVRDWPTVYGTALPKVCAFFAMSSGGSHFVLHKLHGHPNILALKEGQLHTRLKSYFRNGDYPIDEIVQQQLLPSKQDLAQVKWLVLNKPQPAFVAQEFLFNRDNIRSIYCFRNPAALYYSKHWAGEEARQSGPGKQLTQEDVAAWLRDMLFVSLAGFAQIYDPSKDLIVSLECFTAEPNTALAALFTGLNLPVVTEKDLAQLEFCVVCGSKLESQKKKTGKRARLENVLVCPQCGKVHTGPGGYNYIRQVEPKSLSNWKKKDYADELYEVFETSFGAELMSFYRDEMYLQENGHEEFAKRFHKLLERFQ